VTFEWDAAKAPAVALFCGLDISTMAAVAQAHEGDLPRALPMGPIANLSVRLMQVRWQHGSRAGISICRWRLSGRGRDKRRHRVPIATAVYLFTAKLTPSQVHRVRKAIALAANSLFPGSPEPLAVLRPWPPWNPRGQRQGV